MVTEVVQRDTDFDIAKARDQLVFKSNVLIQQSRFSLSKTQQKVLIFLISKIKPDDKELKIIEFSIKEFCEVCGLHEESGRNYQNIKNAIKSLADKSVWMQVIIDGKVEETTVRWIERPFVNRQSGTVRIKFDEYMAPYLLQLSEKFTAYRLRDVMPMKSGYSIPLYELLKSYANLKVLEISIDELKRKMDAENYGRWPDFKRYALDKAVEDINSYSGIEVSYTVIKKGRRFDKVLFTVKEITDVLERSRKYSQGDADLNSRKQSSGSSVEQLEL